MTPHAHRHLERAKSLLDSASDEDLVIAALYLRLAMEAMTYKMLEGYSKCVPASVVKTWQPPQAVRALLQFEPNADQDFTIEIAEGDVPDLTKTEGVVWHHVARHKALTSKWLGRHYHKVGRLLHAPQNSEREFAANADDAAYLLTVFEELTEALSNQIVGTLFPIVTFACSVCGSLVGRNADELRAGKTAICLHNDCGAEFTARQPIGEDIVVTPIHRNPPCTGCGQPMPVRPKKVALGAEIVCSACGKSHLVLAHNWKYAAK